MSSVALTAVTGARMAPGGGTITWTKIAPSLACLAWSNEPLVLMRTTQTVWTRSVFDEIGSKHILQSLGQMGKKLRRVTGGKKKINTKSTTTWKRDKPKPNILVTWLLCISQSVQDLPLAALVRAEYLANNKPNVVTIVGRSTLLLKSGLRWVLTTETNKLPKSWLCTDCASNTKFRWTQGSYSFQCQLICGR